jgi:hypothetical protein
MLRFIGLVLGFSIFAHPAYAYIDPGTATIALQALIGGVAVASLFFRNRIAAVFRVVFGLFTRRESTRPDRTKADDR